MDRCGERGVYLSELSQLTVILVKFDVPGMFNVMNDIHDICIENDYILLQKMSFPPRPPIGMPGMGYAYAPISKI